MWVNFGATLWATLWAKQRFQVAALLMSCRAALALRARDRPACDLVDGWAAVGLGMLAQIVQALTMVMVQDAGKGLESFH